ncbi:MAG: tyrosine-type recombinase/integrase [Lachnospiraceae bacterium]|nr:tyrosine-type recombinase/integrase [Lachnospiraceae bacterium]
MRESCQLLKPLTEQFMEEVRLYGILEISCEQYRRACNSILGFAESTGDERYSAELISSYKDYLDKQVDDGKMCTEYRRFRFRVCRMLSSLAETGKVDFSRLGHSNCKYPVSENLQELVKKILDSYPITDAAKKDLTAPVRHLLWYAENHGLTPVMIDDTTVMKFIIDVIPVSNGGSTGRALRCVKYTTDYLKGHGNTKLKHDYNQLTLKNDHRCMIPAFSESEMLGLASAPDIESTLGSRDYAIILVAYCTGLRGSDIVRIRLSDIDWKKHKLSVVQSKTHKAITCELNGETMNALADYILKWRPECDAHEVFITSKGPYRGLGHPFGRMIDKYCKKAGIRKISFRGFHSIRRAFETIMVSRGVPIDIASQMMGHKSIDEDKPYITYDKEQVSFVAMDFSDVPITTGFYGEAVVGRQSVRKAGESS